MSGRKGEDKPGSFMTLIRRYGPTGLSSASVSAAHLLIQIAIIHKLGAHEIGSVAFMLVLMQLALGVSNALVAAPYAVLIPRQEGGTSAAMAVLPINLCLCLVSGLVVAVVTLGTSLAAAAGFGFTVVLTTLRWFGRTVAIVEGKDGRVALSEFLYVVFLIVGATTSFFLPLSIARVAGWFSVAAIAGMIPHLSPLTHLYRQHWRDCPSYRPVWKQQGGWALTGVITTEMAANAPSYMVVALAGPAAFAPLAIGALFLRPLGVCITALTQIERPRMARDVAMGQGAGAIRSGWHFSAVLLFAWVITALAAGFIFWRFPALIQKADVDYAMIGIAITLYAALALLQALMTPWSVLLQAADHFRMLAFASIHACFITVTGVLILLFLMPPVWTLLAVIAGQALMAVGIGRATFRWMRAEGNNATVSDAVSAMKAGPNA